METVAGRWRAAGGEVVAPREATHEQLARVHDIQYIQRIAQLRDRAVALDPDTYTSPESYEIALLAAGAAIDAVERVMSASSGSHTYALAMMRPPGHHAEPARAMGFCLFNNVAVAAAHARQALGAKRVAIVDYDVHHGNGTQHMFEQDASVLYVSTHQYPYYPGTGAAGEIGSGPGEGFTVNLPLESGGTDADFEHVFDRVALPVLRQFSPDLILVSAGFDAHERDPLATMRATESGFAAMTMALRRVADECCKGRLALVTEGGYDLKALDASLDAVVQTLAGEAAAPKWPAAVTPSNRGRVSAEAAVKALSPYWTLQ
jgi:acetoin utilization deacetylase AcuC-like enzyme